MEETTSECNSVTALNDRGYSLKKKGSFLESGVWAVSRRPSSAMNWYMSPYIYRPHGFERHRYKDACSGHFFIFCSLFWGQEFRRWMYACCLSNINYVGASVSATVTSQARLRPLLQGISVLPFKRFPVSARSCGFLDGWDLGVHQCSVDDIIALDVCTFYPCFFARESMVGASRANMSSARTAVWRANVQPEPKTNGHTNCFIYIYLYIHIYIYIWIYIYIYIYSCLTTRA